MKLRSLLNHLLLPKSIDIMLDNDIKEDDAATASGIHNDWYDELECWRCKDFNDISIAVTTLCKTCFKELVALHKSGDLEATTELAYHYAMDDQPQKALNLYLLTAATGKPEHLLKLGWFYFDKGLSWDLQDVEQGLLLMTKAAEQDLPEAQYALGEAYAKLAWQNRDDEPYKMAALWYEKAANHHGMVTWNSPEWCGNAQLKIAELYYKGLGVTQDYAKAKEWVKEAIARNAYNAKTILAQMLVFGDGAKQEFQWLGDTICPNKKKAAFRKSCRTADDAVLSKARKLIEEDGSLYLLAEMYAAKGNMADAIAIWKKSWANDYAACQVGYCYENGIGVEKDLDKARQYYDKCRSIGFENLKRLINDTYKLL